MAWNAARTEPPAISGCWGSANGRKVPSAVLAAPRGHSANELQREGCEADDVDHASQRLRPIFLALHFYLEDGELRGNYWTSQFSKGHYKLRRKGRSMGRSSLNEAVDV